MVHSQTVHLRIGAPLIWCTMCGTGDGDLDVVVGNYLAPNELLLNDGSGTFTRSDIFPGGRHGHTQCTAHTVHLPPVACTVDSVHRVWHRRRGHEDESTRVRRSQQ